MNGKNTRSSGKTGVAPLNVIAYCALGTFGVNSRNNGHCYALISRDRWQ